MKILWITNIPVPEASNLLNKGKQPFGSWFDTVSKQLANDEQIDISIAFPLKGQKKLGKLRGKSINYYVFSPINLNRHGLKKDSFIIHFGELLNIIKPDLVHIFGTEFPHSSIIIDICNEKGVKTVINIQGLVSIISKHYNANLPKKVIEKYTIRDFLRRNSIELQKKEFYKRGLLEIEAIKNINYLIGRTTWDKACSSQINSSAKYYELNETLRPGFYKKKWDFEKCEKFSVFISQAAYPIKGLHVVIEALKIIITEFPEIKVYVSGHDVFTLKGYKDKLRTTYYAKYIRKLITKYGLSNNIIFLGVLDEDEIVERYLKSNVFVSASFIENESNSLSEAKILGVPVIASYVGGVTDRINHGTDGYLYDPNADYMLAYYLSEVFKNSDIAKDFSSNSRRWALKKFDYDENFQKLKGIYGDIVR